MIAHKTICIVRPTTKVLKNRRRATRTSINNIVYYLRIIMGTTLESINTFEDNGLRSSNEDMLVDFSAHAVGRLRARVLGELFNGLL